MKKERLRCDGLRFRSMFDMSFSLCEGECLLLMGLRGNYQHELANILAGYESNYEGSLYLDGRETAFSSPVQANREGIHLIRDNSALIGNFRLSENVFLVPQYAGTAFFVTPSSLNAKADQLFKSLGLDLKGSSYGNQCDIFEQHAVRTARAVAQDAGIILFENVADVYNSDQLRRFKELLQTLRKAGISVILFSSIITGLFEYADRVFVLRDATIAHIFERDEVDRESLFQALTQNKNTPAIRLEEDGSAGGCLMRLEQFAPIGYAGAPLNLSIRKSCITSLITDNIDSVSSVPRSIFGGIPFHGSMILDGKKCGFVRSADAISRGIGLIDGENDGNLFENFSAETNVFLMLQRLTDFPLSIENKRANRFLAFQAAEKYGIDPELLDTASVESLSNINRMKLALLRWLVLNPRLLLLIHPYCNLDEFERLELSRLLSRIASKGVSMLMVSTLMSDAVDISGKMVRI